MKSIKNITNEELIKKLRDKLNNELNNEENKEVKDAGFIKIKELKDKISEKRYNDYILYFGYIYNIMNRYMYNENVINAYIDTLNLHDIKLLLDNEISNKNINYVKTVNNHYNLDNRSAEEFLINIQIANLVELSTCIDISQCTSYHLFPNRKATHANVTFGNCECDNQCNIDSDNTIYIEQQTSTKMYKHAFVKQNKINALVRRAKKHNKIYILQVYINENCDAKYAVVDIHSNYDNVAISYKKIEKTSEKQLYNITDDLIYVNAKDVVFN